MPNSKDSSTRISEHPNQTHSTYRKTNMEKTPKELLKWYGFDFDRTLAYHGPQDKDIKKGYNLGTGAPIELIVMRLKQYIAAGKNCKIFTARVAPHPDVENFNMADRAEQLRDWCEAQGLPRLDVVCIKDAYMEEIWDDKAVSIEPNTGRIFSWNLDLISLNDMVYLANLLKEELKVRSHKTYRVDV